MSRRLTHPAQIRAIQILYELFISCIYLGQKNAKFLGMSGHEGNFRCYLRQEVINTGNSFEEAKERFFVLTGRPEIPPGTELSDAAREFSESLRLYVGALRRLAHYSARTPRVAPPPAPAEPQIMAHA